jgi:hypothetical protein
MALLAAGAAAALWGCTEEVILPTCGDEITLFNFQHDDLIRVTALGEGQDCTVTLNADTNVLVEAIGPTEGVQLSLGTLAETEPGWIRPHLTRPDQYQLVIHALRTMGTFDVRIRTRTPPGVTGQRAVLVSDPAVLGDGFLVNLTLVMSVVAEDQHGGRMLAELLKRFSTTAHSTRTGPRALYDSLVTNYGGDPSLWSLHVLPFKVVGVANRLDLADGTQCGHVWLTFATTEPAFQPFLLTFAFTQPPRETDLSPHGTVHCEDTARFWARILAYDEASALSRVLPRVLRRDQFVKLQTSEAIGPTGQSWEFREWRKVPNPAGGTELPMVLDNVRMPQTVDVERINAAGQDRNDFLTFVDQNAAALDAYRQLIPEQFLALSARVSPDTSRPVLDLSGLPSSTAAQFPSLRQKIELSGCPACHVTDASFRQLGADGTPSAFYSKELAARLRLVQDMAAGVSPLPNALTVFGPRQTLPILPQ